MNEPPQPGPLLNPPSPEALIPDHALWPWLLALAAGLLLIAILTWLTFRKKAPAVDPVHQRQIAFDEATAALHGIDAASARDAAVQSSLILRKYLSVSASDPALFETHEEFIARHDALQTLTEEARHAAEAGFSRLAALKYAPGTPDDSPAAVVAESRALLETLHHGFAA